MFFSLLKTIQTSTTKTTTQQFSDDPSTFNVHNTSKATDKKRAPIFMKTAHSVTAIEGESATIEVELQCHKSTTVKWLRSVV